MSVTLTLSDTETKAFLELLDLGLKTGGLTALPTVVGLHNAVSRAMAVAGKPEEPSEKKEEEGTEDGA